MNALVEIALLALWVLCVGGLIYQKHNEISQIYKSKGDKMSYNSIEEWETAQKEQEHLDKRDDELWQRYKDKELDIDPKTGKYIIKERQDEPSK